MAFLFLFLIGLCGGSFLNVVIYREIEEVKSPAFAKAAAGKQKLKVKSHFLPDWILGRSYCDHCKRQLAWYDNIPLLSFVILRGRCRSCGKKISLQYPLIELLTGVEFVWLYWLFEKSLVPFSRFEGSYSFLTLLVWLGLAVIATIIFVADWRFGIIPDTAILGGIFLALFKIWLGYRYTAMIDFSLFWSATLASLFFIGLIFVTRGKGMGWGDVKLAGLMGLVLGWPRILMVLYVAFLTGALLGVILILLGKKKLKSQLAFGPFLIGGGIFALIFGDKIWRLLF